MEKRKVIPNKGKLFEAAVGGSSPPGDSPATAVTVLWLPQDTCKEQSGRCYHEGRQIENLVLKAAGIPAMCSLAGS